MGATASTTVFKPFVLGCRYAHAPAPRMRGESQVRKLMMSQPQIFLLEFGQSAIASTRGCAIGRFMAFVRSPFRFVRN